jgi:hypothetical protein
MLLINALICNADTLEFKIHLRSDFARCGLMQAIEVKSIYNNYINFKIIILVFNKKK